MEILPAIDLRGGKVVRLLQGDYDRQTTYGDNPADVARQFADAGAKWIHVVDLDAAKSGVSTNLSSVRAIAAAGVKIELGGGARSDDAVAAMMAAGASRVVVGSAALSDWDWFKRLAFRPEMAGKIALGLDARDGRLAARGWTQQMELLAVNVAGDVKGWPLGAIIYTDISRDGMLSGVNVDALKEIIGVTDVPVIASGGVATLEDISACKSIGCYGAIVGKAYYEGRIDLRKAIEIAK